MDWGWVDVAVPRPPGRLPGISMAGFSAHAPAPRSGIAMVAHPSVTLIVDLSDRDGLTYDVPGKQLQGSVVVGLLPGEVRIGCRGVACLQIRLEPVTAAAVLGGPAELSGTVVPLDEVWGRDAARLTDRLRDTASWDDRFAIAAEVIGRRLAAGRPLDPEVVHAWRRTLASRGRVRTDGLADDVGWSRKRLWSRFRAQLGIAPKRAAQLVRFDHAAHLLVAGRAAARVASEGGYVDQSHLHREVRAFAGLTPSTVATTPWLTIDDVAWPGRH